MAELIKNTSPKRVERRRPMMSHILPQKMTPIAKAIKNIDIPWPAAELVTLKWVLIDVSAGLYMVSIICGNINNVIINEIEILGVFLFI